MPAETHSIEYKQEHKPVIIEKTAPAPAKDWKELAPIAHKSDIQVFSTPIMDKKVQQYESLFPVLGQEPPAQLPQAEFVPEILNPRNLALSQKDLQEKVGGPMFEPKPVELSAEEKKAHKAKIIESRNIGPAKGWGELAKKKPQPFITAPPATQEKVQAYQGHFPELGKENVEEPKAEFTPEILGSNPSAKRVPLASKGLDQRQRLDRQFAPSRYFLTNLSFNNCFRPI